MCEIIEVDFFFFTIFFVVFGDDEDVDVVVGFIIKEGARENEVFMWEFSFIAFEEKSSLLQSLRDDFLFAVDVGVVEGFA